MSIVAACAVDPQTAANNRAAMNAKVFPNPADRQGVYLTFPLESGGVIKKVEVIWHPDEVSQGEIVSRVQGFCRRQNSPRLSGKVGIHKDLGTRNVTLANGQSKPARAVFFECL